MTTVENHLVLVIEALRTRATMLNSTTAKRHLSSASEAFAMGATAYGFEQLSMAVAILERDLYRMGQLSETLLSMPADA